jgi:hypothetical protein
MVEKPSHKKLAHEAVGELIIEWGRLEQRVAVAIWFANDPLNQTPFREGKVELQFPNRLNQYLKHHSPHIDKPDDFRTHLLRLHTIRNDISHNTTRISDQSPQHAFAIHILRIHRDWRTAWKKWTAKWIRVAPLKRQGKKPRELEHLVYNESDVRETITAVLEATAKINQASVALRNAAKLAAQ